MSVHQMWSESASRDKWTPNRGIYRVCQFPQLTWSRHTRTPSCGVSLLGVFAKSDTHRFLRCRWVLFMTVSLFGDFRQVTPPCHAGAESAQMDPGPRTHLTYLHAHTHTHIHIHIYNYTCIDMCMYLYIHSH